MATPGGQKKLTDAAHKGLEIFKKVSAAKEAGGLGISHVPINIKGPTYLTPEALQFAKGLVFFTYYKAGAIATASVGSGFVLAKNSTPPPPGSAWKAGPPAGGPATWSAPLFFSETAFGIGASAGLEAVDGLLLFTDRAGLEEFASGGLSAQTHFTLHADFRKVDPKAAQPTRNEMNQDIRGISAVPYYVQSGAMLDWSTSSSFMRVCKGTIESCYGKGVSYEAVLDGTVPPPQEMQPLYDALNAHMGHWQ